MVHSEAPNLLRWAHRWAEYGQPVFPLFEPVPVGDGRLICSCPAGADCNSPAKHPRVDGGHNQATTNREQIIEWWSRWPNANIGGPTGNLFDVIDVDDPERWAQLLTDLGMQPETYGQIQTGRSTGGVHVLVPADPDARNAAGGRGMPKGIDIRATGGYVVLPPSLHRDGNRYEFGTEFEPGRIRNPGATPWPEFRRVLAEVAREEKTLERAAEAATAERENPAVRLDLSDADLWTQLDADRYWRRVLDRVEREMRGASPGMRNDYLWNEAVPTAARMLAGGFGQDDYESAIRLLAERLSKAGQDAGLDPAESGAARIGALLHQYAENTTDPIAPEAKDTKQPRDGTRSDSEGFSGVGESDQAGVFVEAPLGLSVTEADLREAAWHQYVRDEARRLLRAADQAPTPEPIDMGAPDTEAEWLVEGLLPAAGLVLLAADAKSGKTTFLLNVVKALAEAETFLSPFRYVNGDPRRTAIIDFEMPDSTIRRWIRDLRIDPGLVTAYGLRGKESALNLMDPVRVGEWVDRLTGHDVLVIDPIGPLLNAMGLDENDNSEVGRIIVKIMELADRAGVPLVLMAHHTGKDDSRGPRGASRFTGAPDAIWSLRRAADDTSTFRVLRGRDTESFESLIEMDPETRQMTFSGAPPAKPVGRPPNPPGVLDESIKGVAPMAKHASARQVYEAGRGKGLPGWRKADVLQRVAELVEDGVLVESGGGFVVVVQGGSETGSEGVPEPENTDTGEAVPEVPQPFRVAASEPPDGSTASGTDDDSEPEPEPGTGLVRACADCGQETGAPGFRYCRACAERRMKGSG